MTEEKFKSYLIYTITLLKDFARKAKMDADLLKESSKEYALGEIMGYYSIFTLLKHQAFVFCIDQKVLGLADIRPDADLLGLHANPELAFAEENWAIDAINEEKIKGYLYDFAQLLKEQASEAKKDADSPKEGNERYNQGHLMAYRTAISLMKNQTLVFNIDQEEIGLADIEPERDLL